MMIKLTKKCDGEPMYVNTHHITAFSINEHGTVIDCYSDALHPVLETPEEILALMEPKREAVESDKPCALDNMTEKQKNLYYTMRTEAIARSPKSTYLGTAQDYGEGE